MYNALFIGHPTYLGGVINELIDQKIIDFALTEYDPLPGQPIPRQDEKIKTFHRGKIMSLDYSEFDFEGDAFAGIDEELLEKVNPFESAMIGMGADDGREISVEECKYRYYTHLSKWNEIFCTYRINFVFFDEAPYTQYHYVIYSLSKVYDTRRIILKKTDIDIIKLYSYDIGEECGDLVDRYEDIESSGERIELEEPSESFYCDVSKNDDIGPNPANCKPVNAMRYNKARDGMRGLREFVLSLIKTHSLDRYKYYRWKKVVRQGYLKYCYSNIDEYKNERVEANNSNEEYVYFKLPKHSEYSVVSTEPRQIALVEIVKNIAIACAARRICLYIQEPDSGISRRKEFYKIISAYKNIKIVPPQRDSGRMISKSLAVIGTVDTSILRGIALGRPALVWGKGCVYKSMPGVFSVNDLGSIRDALQKILDGYKVDQQKVKMFLFAVQDVGVPYDFKRLYHDPEYHFDVDIYEKTKNRLVEIIKSYLKNGIQENAT